METGTPIDHKRIQGILIWAAGLFIAQYTDWEVTTEQLTVGIGEAMFVLGWLWNMYGGIVAKGPIKWFNDKVKINPEAVTVVDKTKLSENEVKAFDMLMEKGK